MKSYGPRLTRDEFEARMAFLHEHIPLCPTPEDFCKAKSQEIDAIVDYRLGRFFPLHRRHELLSVMVAPHPHTWKDTLADVLSWLAHPSRNVMAVPSSIHLYKDVLTDEEMAAFFDVERQDICDMLHGDTAITERDLSAQTRSPCSRYLAP